MLALLPVGLFANMSGETVANGVAGAFGGALMSQGQASGGFQTMLQGEMSAADLQSLGLTEGEVSQWFLNGQPGMQASMQLEDLAGAQDGVNPDTLTGEASAEMLAGLSGDVLTGDALLSGAGTDGDLATDGAGLEVGEDALAGEELPSVDQLSEELLAQQSAAPVSVPVLPSVGVGVDAQTNAAIDGAAILEDGAPALQGLAAAQAGAAAEGAATGGVGAGTSAPSLSAQASSGMPSGQMVSATAGEAGQALGSGSTLQSGSAQPFTDAEVSLTSDAVTSDVDGVEDVTGRAQQDVTTTVVAKAAASEIAAPVAAAPKRWQQELAAISPLATAKVAQPVQDDAAEPMQMAALFGDAAAPSETAVKDGQQLSQAASAQGADAAVASQSQAAGPAKPQNAGSATVAQSNVQTASPASVDAVDAAVDPAAVDADVAAADPDAVDPGEVVKKAAGGSTTVAAGTAPSGPASANSEKIGAPAGTIAAQTDTVDVTAQVAPSAELVDEAALDADADLLAMGDVGTNARLQAGGSLKTDVIHADLRNQSGQVAMQVAGAMAKNLQNGNTRFQMRFDPPELGRVEVSMKVSSDGTVHAHMIVERPETLDMFMRDQRGLERALQDAGLNANSENLQFSLRDQGGQGQGFAGNDGFFEDDGFGFGSGGAGDDVDAVEQITQLQLGSGNSGLDIRI